MRIIAKIVVPILMASYAVIGAFYGLSKEDWGELRELLTVVLAPLPHVNSIK
jgi:hypothetical protein